MVNTHTKNVLPFSLTLLSSIACIASHFKTGSGALKTIIKVISYDTLYLLICRMGKFFKALKMYNCYKSKWARTFLFAYTQLKVTLLVSQSVRLSVPLLKFFPKSYLSHITASAHPYATDTFTYTALLNVCALV